MNSHCCDSSFTQPPRIALAKESHGVVKFSNRTNRYHSVKSLLKVFSTLRTYMVRKHNQRIDRQAFKHLLALDDNLLRDIGVTRNDVVWASKLPLSVDASAKLNEIARRR